MADELSPAGYPIQRHSPRERELELVDGDEETVEAVTTHVTAHLGEISWTYHELLSDLVRVDVHVVAPTAERNFHTLVTTGMSDRPMTVPNEIPAPAFAELMLHLPPEWPLRQEDLGHERNYWPIRWLKFLARLPHEYETWLDAWHTVPNGDPPEPFADGTGLAAMMLTPPILAPEEFGRLVTPSGREIAFFEVLPLHADELALKLEKGTDELLSRLDAVGVSPVIDAARGSCVR